MKEYVKDFLKNDAGVETIEFIGLLCVGAALIGVVALIGGSMIKSAQNGKANIENAISQIEQMGQGQ